MLRKQIPSGIISCPRTSQWSRWSACLPRYLSGWRLSEDHRQADLSAALQTVSKSGAKFLHLPARHRRSGGALSPDRRLQAGGRRWRRGTALGGYALERAAGGVVIALAMVTPSKPIAPISSRCRRRRILNSAVLFMKAAKEA